MMHVKQANKQQAIEDFFGAYADIEGSLNDKSEEQLGEYLDGDIFIAVASAATGIAETEFVEFALGNVGNVY